MKNVTVVLPTYNEKDNIGKLLQIIMFQQKSIPVVNLSVLVVDDSSPDGTADVVKDYMRIYPEKIHLISGKKSGLGAAYIRGFKYAMRTLKADIVFEMDADFSHDPNDIPRFLKAIIDGGADFVIGSRYIQGGSIPDEWSLLRKLNSKWGNIFARYVAGIRNVHDTTSGFRAITTSILRRINLNKLNVKGYAFQINVLNEARKKGAFVKEVPIVFIDRKHGESKIRIKDITEFILSTFKLRFPFLNKIGVIFRPLLFGVMFQLFLIVVNGSIGFNINFLVLLLSTIMIMQGSFTLWWMLYAWNHPESVEKNKSPKQFANPNLSFSAIVPARHEEKVIEHTIDALSSIDYPEALKEVLIACKADDFQTITAVQKSIERTGKDNIKLVVFNDLPVNKPHALNVALGKSTKDIIVVFDAEDDPHRDIYNIANTIMFQQKIDVLQSGVQLMNYRSTWFSTINILEYFFWFKSTLHYFAKSGIVPLGGNTVFFKKDRLIKIGGWDEDCLTEDADIGIRLSIAGAKMRIVYDEKHVTKEESPLEVAGFVKQRTRWSQGFLQVLQKGDWMDLSSFKLRLLASYILLSPMLQALFFLYIPFSLVILLFFKLPVWIVMFSTIPLYILALQLVTFNIGLYLFTQDYRLKYPLWMPLKILITFLPFQFILGYSSLRAIMRMLINNNVWEKTQHMNAHRRGQLPIDRGFEPLYI